MDENRRDKDSRGRREERNVKCKIDNGEIKTTTPQPLGEQCIQGGPGTNRNNRTHTRLESSSFTHSPKVASASFEAVDTLRIGFLAIQK